MVKHIAFFALAAISLSSGISKKEPCACDFKVEVTGVDLGLPYRLCCFGVEGRVSKKESALFQEECLLIHDKPLDTTATWFMDRAPCGTEKSCVERIVFERDTFGYAEDPTSYQKVRLHIYLK